MSTVQSSLVSGGRKISLEGELYNKPDVVKFYKEAYLYQASKQFSLNITL